MKLKELVGKYDIVDIYGFINRFGREDIQTLSSEIGPLDIYDFTSLKETHRRLKGEDSCDNDTAVADRYMVRFYGTHARRYRSKKQDLVPFCGIYDKTTDEHLSICREYVKNIGDFAECDVEPVETLPELTMASIASLNNQETAMSYQEVRNDICKCFLTAHNFESVIDVVEAKFKNVKYYPVSAIGHEPNSEGYRPWGVLEPMIDILNQARVWGNSNYSRILEGEE